MQERSPRRRVVASISAALALAAALSGCVGAASSSPSAAIGPAPSGIDAHRWYAIEGARATLTGFTLPAGAVRLVTAPRGSPVATPPSYPGSKDLIDLDRLWRTTGDMSVAIAWARQHVAPGWATTESGTEGGPGGVLMEDVGFTLPDGAPYVESRQVLFSAAPDGARHVAVRMDVQVIWVPTRPAWSYVPRDATTATLTSWPATGDAPPRTTKTSDRAMVAALRALVNRMTVSTGGTEHCGPARASGRYSLRLRAPGSPQVEVSYSGYPCGGVDLTVQGHPVLTMTDPDGRLAKALVAGL